MSNSEIRELCLKFSGTKEQIQWGSDLLFKVAGKMFLCMGTESAKSCYSIKCEEETFYEMTELSGIKPAPYLARARWVQIDPSECRLKNDEIAALVRKSYDLVVAKLPKKTQQLLKKNPSSQVAKRRRDL